MSSFYSISGAQKTAHSRFIDLCGVSFGALTVLDRADNDAGGSARWRCVCSCGQERVVAGTGLRAGRNKSCGCLSPRFLPVLPLTGRKTNQTRTYKIWVGMHSRCMPSKSEKTMRLYYLKGVRVCTRWHDFDLFLQDMGDAPSGHSIDRINGSYGYEPGNCRWATSKQQANNTDANHLVAFNGKSLNVTQWAEVTGIKANTILCRIRRGWALERVFQFSPALLHAEHKRQDKLDEMDLLARTIERLNP